MSYQIQTEENEAVVDTEESVKEGLVSIPAQLLQRTVDYLAKRPYVEVYMLIGDILASTSTSSQEITK